MDFIEKFEGVLESGEATLDDVVQYMIAIGVAAAHHADGYASLLYTDAEIAALSKKSDKVTDMAVGGNLPVIFWMIKQATGSSYTARNSLCKERSELLLVHAQRLMDLADIEMEALFPGSSDNFRSERENVYEPLPEDGWKL